MKETLKANKITYLLKNNKAQGMIEYIIIVALVAISAIGITELLGQTVRTKLSQITSSLQDKNDNAGKKLPTASAKYFNRKGMNNFNNNTNKTKGKKKKSKWSLFNF